jgi:hypothetical protein
LDSFCNTLVAGIARVFFAGRQRSRKVLPHCGRGPEGQSRTHKP